LLKIFKGLKVTIVSLLLLLLVFTLVEKTSSIWLVKIPLFEQVLYGLFTVTIILASYFSRSRLALLAGLLGIFYFSLLEFFPWSSWLLTHDKWIIIFAAMALATFSQVKDRGLISIHGLYRLFLIAAIGVAAYFWQFASAELALFFNRYVALKPWTGYLAVELPLLVCGLIIFWQSLREDTLVAAALLTTFVVWIAHYYQFTQLPWTIILSLLTLHYLAVVIVDSYFLAYRDELTSLPSRRALNQLALSLGKRYTVAMLDIDHFKKFNDTYGHDIGDQVLRLVASKLAQVKNGGKVFRYGGEEFTIVFPRKNNEQCEAELDRIRQAVQDYKIVIRQPQRKTKKERTNKKVKEFTTVSVAISIGLANRTDKQTFEQVLKNADLALYRAKKKGRNNVST
jgi:diguanylate cyclase (GGDEF)-like protein